jgi:D-arabinose 1-dehydrogenase-like Zn-dependent alcohol dehydrogenase
MVEPGGNSLRSVEAANLSPGGRLLVLGSGTIGLLAAQIGLARGLDVHVAGVPPSSLKLARDLGVRHTHQIADLQLGSQPRSTPSLTPAVSKRCPLSPST